MAEIPARTRNRLLGTLFLSSGLVRTGFIAALTVAALAAEDILDSVVLAGMPAAASTVGVAIGTTPVAVLMAARGRRIGIAIGLVVAAAGAALAALAVAIGSFPLLVLGMLMLGMGSAGDRLSRYAASDISTETQRAFAISIVVWAGTVGSVLGPALLETAEGFAERLGLEGLAGPFLLAAAAVTAAVAVTYVALRPDPLSFAARRTDLAGRSRPLSALDVLAVPQVQFAVIALMVGQIVMVIIMAMTPIHIRNSGDDLGIIGLIIAAHTFGMFALSPLTGWVADRMGRPRVMIAGHLVLAVAALLAASAGGDSTVLLFIALFLLGVGWNFSFIAGSAYLSESAPAELRVRVEGLVDTVVWASGAVAFFSSGVLFAMSGYAALCLIGAGLIALPAAAAYRFRKVLLGPAYARSGG